MSLVRNRSRNAAKRDSSPFAGTGGVGEFNDAPNGSFVFRGQLLRNWGEAETPAAPAGAPSTAPPGLDTHCVIKERNRP